MDLQLNDIEESALTLLAIRASETKRQNARFRDRKSLEIVETLDIDETEWDRYAAHELITARTVLFDSAVKESVGKYLDAVCVNLNCGLDDRYTRVDNGWIQWLNIDLPAAIEIRKKAFSETRREKMIACDIQSPDWTDAIPKDHTVIIIAEDLLLYYSREQLKEFLNAITSAFPQGVLIADLMRRKAMKDKEQSADQGESRFGWGIMNSGKDLLLLDESSRLTFVKETSFDDQLKKGNLISRILGIVTGSKNNRVCIFEWRKQ